MSMLRSAAVGLCLVAGLSSSAQSRGFDWFFANIKPSGKCGLGASEIAVSYYEPTGRKTAASERYDGKSFTAASRTHRFGTHINLHVPGTNRAITVRINDRGPFGCGKYSCAQRARMGLPTLTLDLSPAAASALGGRTTHWVCAR